MLYVYSYTTEVEERKCLIVLFITRGHPAFSVPNLTIASIILSFRHTASFLAANFPINHIVRLKFEEKYCAK
jgi:hypothetical protein